VGAGQVAGKGNSGRVSGRISCHNSSRIPVRRPATREVTAGIIYAVSAEDHYLRVHTSLGETMVLMRLADAVRQLGFT